MRDGQEWMGAFGEEKGEWDAEVKGSSSEEMQEDERLVFRHRDRQRERDRDTLHPPLYPY